MKINLGMGEINFEINHNTWELDNEYFVRSFCESKTYLIKKVSGIRYMNRRDFMSFKSSQRALFATNNFVKIFANFKGKHLCWSLLLIKLQVSTPTTL